jgi:hypothetical protein
MQYFVYIDESGGFQKDNDKSIVGGLVTREPPGSVRKALQEAVTKTNRDFGTEFTIKDIHAAPVLHPESTGKAHETERFLQISRDAHEVFIGNCFEAVQALWDHFFCRVNQSSTSLMPCSRACTVCIETPVWIERVQGLLSGQIANGPQLYYRCLP